MNRRAFMQSFLDLANADPVTLNEEKSYARQTALRIIAAAIGGRDSLRDVLTSYAEEYPKGFSFCERPTVVTGGDGAVAIEWRVDCLNVGDPYSGEYQNVLFAVLMYSDEQYGAGNLRCCKLASCGKLFFVTKGTVGRPRTAYCSSKHMKIAHEKDSARRHRARKARSRSDRENSVSRKSSGKTISDVARRVGRRKVQP